jgi:hypothetical protein
MKFHPKNAFLCKFPTSSRDTKRKELFCVVKAMHKERKDQHALISITYTDGSPHRNSILELGLLTMLFQNVPVMISWMIVEYLCEIYCYYEIDWGQYKKRLSSRMQVPPLN